MTASGEQRFCSQCGAERFGPFCWRCGAPASAKRGEAPLERSFDAAAEPAAAEPAVAGAPAGPAVPAWVGEIALPALIAFAAALASLAFPWLALLIGLAGFVALARALRPPADAAPAGPGEAAG